MTMLRTVSLRLGTISSAIALSVAPAQAATFAEARTQLQIDGFRVDGVAVSPFATDATSATDTTVSGNADAVVFLSDAEAFFQVDPPALTGFSTALSAGSGEHPYIGQSEAAADAFGTFAVQGLFEFDFAAVLGLQTAVDSLQDERAAAAGVISFDIVASNSSGTSLLDSFTLSGAIASFDEIDTVDVRATSGFALHPTACFADVDANGLCREQSFGGRSESALALAEGSYSRQFDEPTLIALFKTQSTLTAVREVPEGGMGLALVLMLAFWLRLRQSQRSSARFSMETVEDTKVLDILH